MKQFANSWDSPFLFYAPKVIASLIFVTIGFVPDSWTTPMVVVGFVALALEIVLDILRYRHRVANEVEEEYERDEEYQVQEISAMCEEEGVKPNSNAQKEPESKWKKIERWGEMVDKFDDYAYWGSLLVIVICLFCVKWIIPLLK